VDKHAERLLQRFGYRPRRRWLIWGGESAAATTPTTELAAAWSLPGYRSCARRIRRRRGGRRSGRGARRCICRVGRPESTRPWRGIAPAARQGRHRESRNYLGFPGGNLRRPTLPRGQSSATAVGARTQHIAEITGWNLAAASPVPLRMGVDGGRAGCWPLGARYRRLAVPGLESFEGRACLYYAANFRRRDVRHRAVSRGGW